MPQQHTKFWRTAKFAAVVALLGSFVWFGNDLLRRVETDDPSTSMGSASDGALRNGVRLPSAGPNFVTYSRLGSLLGRTSVHREVRDIIVDSYAALETKVPGQRWVYGEMGWPSGGEFWPHRTHQNGLVADFMVPLIRDGEPVPFPHAPWDGFGYAVDLDASGKLPDGSQIDYRAVALHLDALDRAAGRRGYRIRRVIFAPELRKELLRTPEAASIRGLRFNQNPVWVRHDDHYHVEFARK